MKRIVLVTGTRSRAFAVRDAVWERLETYDRDGLIVLHGGADGADNYAGSWADKKGIQQIRVPAPWGLGLRAGPMRNTVLVELATRLQPWCELSAEAFPAVDSRGTWDCIRKLRAADIEPRITEV